MVKHFTNKAWLVTYEESRGYNRYYGIVGIFNKPAEAQAKLDKLNESIPKPTFYTRHPFEYKIQEVTLDGKHQLFEFDY